MSPIANGTSNGNGTANGSSPAPTLYLTPIVHSISLTELEILPLALLCVLEGRVAWIDKVADASSAPSVAAARGLDWATVSKVVVEEGFICPGLIDTHTHAPQYPNNGLGHSLQLLEWLQQLTFPLEQTFSDDKVARKVYEKVVKRNLASGTTTACYYGTLHSSTTVLADICVEQGQRALVGRCCMDTGHDTYVEESTEESMAATHKFLAHFAAYPSSAASLVQPILTPRFALSCTADLMGQLGALAAAKDLPVQTHISENHTEIKLVKEIFSSETYAGVYDRFGLLRKGTILAHGVHLDDVERKVIKDSGAGVSHCPSSNVNLNSGAARVLDMLDAGIPVGLGTDCSGGPSTGIQASIRDANTTSRVLTFEGKTERSLTIPELFFLATRGGAELCRLDDVGNFLQGNQFDALWIKPASPGMWVEDGEPTDKVLEKWLFAGDDRDIASVWVRGRQVVGGKQ